MANWRTLRVAATAFGVAACGSEALSSGEKETPAPSELSRSIAEAMDPTVNPCQDFYRYACGGWLDTAKLAADQTRKVRGFSLAIEANVSRLDTVMQDALDDASADADADATRVKAMFGACIDEATIEEAGTAPLAPYLEAIDGVVDGRTLMSVVGRLSRDGIGAFLGVSTFVLPEGTALILDEVVFPLPEKDAYLRQDGTSVSLRDAYVAHVARLFELAGENSGTARSKARAVLAIETELAKSALAPADRRDLVNLYHATHLAELKSSTPAIDWDAFFEPLGQGGITATINVTVPVYFATLEKLLSSASLDDLRTYLRWCVLHSTVADLPKAFRDADFDFFGHTLSGAAEPESRRKACTARARATISDSVGRLYVKRYFPEESRNDALAMIETIKDAFVSSLHGLDWIDEATRRWSVDKSRAMASQVGYPDTWKTYDGLALSPDDAFGNARAVARFASDAALFFVGKPPDRIGWPWDAATVNAAHLAGTNTVNLPAGILQPPFYSGEYPLAVNHGAIGQIIGHELTHGFDDQGRIFGADGVPGTYWSEDAILAFNQRTACVKEQYDQYELEPGLKVNGALTLGENIADLGGMKLAFRAFQARKEQARVAPIEGLTDEQAFFVAYAQTRCEVATDEEARLRLATDPHAPGRFRVIGPLSNTPQFAEAFACKSDDAMVRADRCEVW